MDALLQYGGGSDTEEEDIVEDEQYQQQQYQQHYHQQQQPTPFLATKQPESSNTNFPEDLINKITEQIENVVNEKWNAKERGMERVSTAPVSIGKASRIPRPLHKSHSQSDDLVHHKFTHNKPPTPPNISTVPYSPHIPSRLHSPTFSGPRPHSAPATPSQMTASPPFQNTQTLPHPHLHQHSNPHNHPMQRPGHSHKFCHNYNTGPTKKVVNMEEWDKVYAKWKSIEDEKAEKLKNKKEEKRKAEMAEASFKPRISKNSDKMVHNRENIVDRMVNRKAETDKKIGQLRKTQEDYILSTIKPIPTINHMSHSMQRPRGVMEQWVRERDKKLQAMRSKQKDQEEEELKGYFKPKINPKSANLASKKEGEQQDVAVRLSEKVKKRNEKLEEMRKTTEYTHKPQINPRSKAIKLDAPVHERLYKVGMDSIVEKHKFIVDNWDFSLNSRKPLALEVEPNSPTNDIPPNFMEHIQEELGDDELAALQDDEDWQQYEEQQLILQQQQLFHHYQQQLANGEEYGLEDAGNEQFDQYYNGPPVYMNEGDVQETDYEDGSNSGYDEDLRRMMMEAGFFQTSHSRSYINEPEYQC